MKSLLVCLFEVFFPFEFLIAYSLGYEHLVSVGGSALLQCASNLTQTSIVIIWEHNGASILNHNPESDHISRDRFTSRVKEDASTVELQISNISFRDAGNYSCIFYLRSGVPKKKDMTLRVQGYPLLSLHSNTTIEGNFLEANCCIQFAPPSLEEEIFWTLEGFPDLPHMDTSSVAPTSSQDGTICAILRIQTLRAYNNKQLQCYVKSRADTSTAVILDVLYPPTVNILGTFKDSTLSVEINTLLNITCVADGNPLPVVTLQREYDLNNWETTNMASKQNQMDDETIKVSFLLVEVDTDDKGHYRCFADSLKSMDTSFVNFYVDITIPTTIQMLMPPSIKIEEGDELVISCQTEGNPEPNVQLQRNIGKNNWNSFSMKPIPIFKQDMVSTWMFRLEDQKTDLTGSYRCVGFNGVGDHAISQEVIVEATRNVTVIQDDTASTFPVAVIAVISTVLTATLIVGAVVLRGLLSGKCHNESKSFGREIRHLPATPKEVPIIQEYEENLELYNTISDDNEGCIAKHIEIISKENIKFISKLKRGRHIERWLGMIKKTTSFDNEKNVCVSFLSDNVKSTMSSLWSRHLHFVVKLPRHENVVTTIGTFEDNGIAYCVQQYLPYGNLRTFLETEYGQSYIYGNTVEPIPQEFVTFALDVVCGMEFLRYHGWIHPGLCALKVMLDNGTKRCKLHDFCYMCNRTDKVNFILENKPQNGFLHVAPEVIQRDEYSYRSDVWAVGVLMWEIFSYGAIVPNEGGRRCHADIQNKLPKPSNCPRQLYDIMTQCWLFDPMSRPTFIDLEERLKSTAETYQMTIISEEAQRFPAETDQEMYATEIHVS